MFLGGISMIKLLTNQYNRSEVTNKGFKEFMKLNPNRVVGSNVYYYFNRNNATVDVIFDHPKKRVKCTFTNVRSSSISYRVAACIAENIELLTFEDKTPLVVDVDCISNFDEVLEKFDTDNVTDIFVKRVELSEALMLGLNIYAIYVRYDHEKYYKPHLFCYDRSFTPVIYHELSFRQIIAFNRTIIDAEFELYKELEQIVEDSKNKYISESDFKSIDIKDFNDFNRTLVVKINEAKQKAENNVIEGSAS